MHWIALRPGPEADVDPDALLALGGWALQYTPKVARLDDALLLEVSASERLWGGWRALLRQIYTSNKPVAPVQYARGATSLIAYARLQDKALARTSPDDLPLHTLTAARPHLATLERLGCSHWGQLRALPRGGVARRFGAPLLAALDRAYGLQPELDVGDRPLELGGVDVRAPGIRARGRCLTVPAEPAVSERAECDGADGHHHDGADQAGSAGERDGADDAEQHEDRHDGQQLQGGGHAFDRAPHLYDGSCAESGNDGDGLADGGDSADEGFTGGHRGLACNAADGVDLLVADQGLRRRPGPWLRRLLGSRRSSCGLRSSRPDGLLFRLTER